VDPGEAAYLRHVPFGPGLELDPGGLERGDQRIEPRHAQIDHELLVGDEIPPPLG
jgi:hypothetical protein